MMKRDKARVADRFATVGSALRRLGRNKRGNVSITYAFALVPTIALVGLGTDWFKQQSFKKRLDAASDAAAIAAITTAKAYISANSQQPNAMVAAIAAGTAQARRNFAVNAGSASLNLDVTPTIDFPLPSGPTYTATVRYATDMPTSFGRLVGTPTFQVRGQATSSLTTGSFIDFYVALDVSGSMGIPTSTDGQKMLAAINPDQRSIYPTGCVFACHFPGNKGYGLAGENNIALRVDTVGSAVTSLLSTAAAVEQQAGLTNEFRVGLYPFIAHPIDAAPLSADFTKATQVAASLGSTYLDQGWSPSTMPAASNGTKIGSGGTHFETFSTDMPNFIKTPIDNATGKVGNGQTAATPKAFLFLVTDGIDNAQLYTTASGFNGSKPQLPTTNFCSMAQSYGFTVAVLYIPYVPITDPNPNFAGNEDGKVNDLIPQVPSTLRSCASPGFYFEAKTASDINTAMQTMFFQALQVARLTN